MRVLLREPEQCSVCGGVYLSLYKLRACLDHSDLTELHKPRTGKGLKIAPLGTPKYGEASEAEKENYAFIDKSEIGAAEGDDEEAEELI